MAIDLTPLSTATTAAQGLSNLILVTPANLGVVGGYTPQTKDGKELPKLLFHTEGENSIALESDVTDHYVEDNTAINDQVALRPEIITVRGFIGDLNDVAPYGLQTAKQAAEKLTVINAYTPVLSATALSLYNRAAFLYSVGINAANAAVASYSSINGLINGQNNETVITGTETDTQLRNLTGNRGRISIQSKQQIAFQQFYGYWRQRTLFTVQTPWAIFKNMVIKTLRATQSEDSNSITDFEITFKIMRFAKTENVNSTIVNASNLDGRAGQSSITEVETVTTNPIPSTSATDQIAESFPEVSIP